MKTSDNGRRVWCWQSDALDERWEGPFESRDDAIAEAFAESDADEIMVNTGVFHDAGKYADIIDLHERLNETCIDDDVYTDDCGDDPLTLVGDKVEAQKEFAAFCRRWFAPHQFTVEGPGEVVARAVWEAMPTGSGPKAGDE